MSNYNNQQQCQLQVTKVSDNAYFLEDGEYNMVASILRRNNGGIRVCKVINGLLSTFVESDLSFDNIESDSTLMTRIIKTIETSKRYYRV